MFVKSAIIAVSALLAAAPSAAHMTMKYPAPVFASNNPFNGGKVLDTYTAPMSGRSQFPCRDASVIAALGTEAGAAVDTWNAGESRSIVITGGAFHGGGSCQLSLSYDSGATFKVIKSFIGNCPSANGDTSYDVVIPSDAPSGDAVFAWTWFNKIGNREMYMNCAVVNIAGGAAKRDVDVEKRAIAFSSRPNIFVANIDGSSGCRTKETIDVDFPNPGPDVVNTSSALGLYIDAAVCSDAGNTGAGTPGPAGGDSGSGSGDAAPADPATTEAPVATSTQLPGGVFVPTSSAAVTESESEPTETASSTVEQPTTLVTSTKIATSSSAAPSATFVPSPPAGAFTVGEACSDEGVWNCIGGSSFQRCASGMWSGVIPMASGTSCQSGVSDTLVMLRKRGGARIFAQ